MKFSGKKYFFTLPSDKFTLKKIEKKNFDIFDSKYFLIFKTGPWKTLTKIIAIAEKILWGEGLGFWHSKFGHKSGFNKIGKITDPSFKDNFFGGKSLASEIFRKFFIRNFFSHKLKSTNFFEFSMWSSIYFFFQIFPMFNWPKSPFSRSSDPQPFNMRMSFYFETFTSLLTSGGDL